MSEGFDVLNQFDGDDEWLQLEDGEKSIIEVLC